MLFLSRRSRRWLEHKIKRQGHLKNTPEYKALFFFASKLSGIFLTDRQKTIENGSFSGTNNS